MQIQVEVSPWLSDALRPGASGSLLLQVEASTLRDALARLATADEDFARLVFDVTGQHPREHVQVLHNDRLVAWLAEADRAPRRERSHHAAGRLRRRLTEGGA